MHNLVYLIGRINGEIKKREYVDGDIKATMNIDVQRQSKDENGEYLTDTFKVELRNTIATQTCKYCNTGDLVGIKGRLESDGKEIKILVEKISFLTSNANNED